VLRTGAWRAWLDCEGQELPFELTLNDGPDGWQAGIRNGTEELLVDRVALSGDSVEFEFTQYDAMIRARVLEEGRHLEGIWRRRLGEEKWAQLPFHADWGGGRFRPRGDGTESPVPLDPGKNDRQENAPGIEGRWQVEFEARDEPAVGLFSAHPGGEAEGTFITSTGDYRFLAGDFVAGRLRLSRFDGANAFLFHATLRPDGRLEGRFWEGGYHRERWLATRDDEAVPPATFDALQWRGSIDLQRLLLSDPDGKIHSLAEDEFKGKALILEIFGTWCPNCHDASRLLQDLYRSYHQDGLQVVGIAFEMTGDFERNAHLVRLYRDGNSLQYPLLLAGRDQKRSPQEIFPMLEGTFGYPTVLFLAGDGRIRAVHTGFTGPATGEAYRQLKRAFEAIVLELLEEKP
jgi:thiol-disulfide isomerase/thioredoxin